MNTLKLRNRRPFALAEVCVAIGVVGLVTAYLFSSIHTSIRQYTNLRDEICCNELADEALARSVAQFLINPPDFDAATAPEAVSYSTEVGIYTVSLQTSCDKEESEEKEGTPTIDKDPVALIEFTVAACGGAKSADRSTKLCVCKEAG